MYRIHRHRRLPFDPYTVFDVAADIEAYPSFLPYCVATRIVDVRKDGEMIVDNRFRWGALSKRFRSHARFDRPYGITIRSADRARIPFDIHWTFAPEGKGETMVGFEMGLKMYMPGTAGLVENILHSTAWKVERAFLHQVWTVVGSSRSRSRWLQVS